MREAAVWLENWPGAGSSVSYVRARSFVLIFNEKPLNEMCVHVYQFPNLLKFGISCLKLSMVYEKVIFQSKKCKREVKRWSGEGGTQIAKGQTGKEWNSQNTGLQVIKDNI